MKYLFITLKVQDGEHEHTHRVLTTCKSEENVLKAAHKYAKDYWGKSTKEKDSDWYFFQGGTLAIKIQNVEVLSQFEFDLMSKIFSGQARPGYFQIVQAGYEAGLHREEVEINCGENGKIMIHQDEDKLGFIIDVYGQNDEVGTMTIWEEDLYSPDEDDKQEIIDTCKRKYEEGGVTAVIDYIGEARSQGDNMQILNINYEICNGCDAEMPSLDHICLVCGQSTIPQD